MLVRLSFLARRGEFADAGAGETEVWSRDRRRPKRASAI